ncbi:MAG: DUF222 domain-containing protein [Marmoricola sp.]
MAIQASEPDRHPVLRFADALAASLDKAHAVEPAFMSASEKREALVTLHRQERRLVALRLKILAVSDDVTEETGARDAAVWLAHHTLTENGPNAADLRLAVALDKRWSHLAAALVAGRVNQAQARVIVHGLEQLPGDLDPEIPARAEQHLVELAERHRPRELQVLGRRILEVVAPEVADDHEARALEAEERRARETTSLRTKRLGDGCSRITIEVPDAVAGRLGTYLDAFTSPRHDTGHDPTGALGIPGVQDGDRIPVHRKRGQAFCALLEAIDPVRLPLHGGDATTVMVTVGLDRLHSRLAAAGVDGAEPITAAEARRLACTARILPVVLGDRSEPLDLGRARRLFSPAQRKAMAVRDRRCRAEGCTVPASWCEAHHAGKPWSEGGRTDLADGVLLCSWHHHRAHDDRYRSSRLPNGDIRFSRRT